MATRKRDSSEDSFPTRGIVKEAEGTQLYLTKEEQAQTHIFLRTNFYL